MIFSGGSITIFLKVGRLSSAVKRRFFINFFSGKLHFADAVEMGIDKQKVAILCRLGNALNLSLVNNSFSCMYITFFGCLIRS